MANNLASWKKEIRILSSIEGGRELTQLMYYQPKRLRRSLYTSEMWSKSPNTCSVLPCNILVVLSMSGQPNVTKQQKRISPV